MPASALDCVRTPCAHVCTRGCQHTVHRLTDIPSYIRAHYVQAGKQYREISMPKSRETAVAETKISQDTCHEAETLTEDKGKVDKI